jgi:hypothetical protein
MWHMMMKILNPFMKWLLRSPLHGIVSNSYMLINVTGRKSGSIYTTPVQYGQRGDVLYIVTSSSYKWWKNLQGGAHVTLHLRGQDYEALAQITADPSIIAEFFHIIYPSMTPQQIGQLTPNRVAVQIQLQPQVMQVSKVKSVA